jgi:AcrR family transcriptional regulator
MFSRLHALPTLCNLHFVGIKSEGVRLVKLSKDLRREQLLDVAFAIVREQGADELTLGSLALRAGVSRPIAYEHFKTRAGLLIALFQRLENRYIRALRDGLSAAPRDIGSVAADMSNAYFDCLSELGPEGLAISAALQGSEEMAKQQRRMSGDYIEIMCMALRPFTVAPAEDLRILCVGLLGAADAMAREVHASRTPHVVAVRALHSLIEKAIGD